MPRVDFQRTHSGNVITFHVRTVCIDAAKLRSYFTRRRRRTNPHTSIDTYRTMKESHPCEKISSVTSSTSISETHNPVTCLRRVVAWLGVEKCRARVGVRLVWRGPPAASPPGTIRYDKVVHFAPTITPWYGTILKVVNHSRVSRMCVRVLE